MLSSLHCPHGLSEQIEEYKIYQTITHGSQKIFTCIACQKVFSETKATFLEGLKKPMSLLVSVLKARSEGLRLNAACRVFEISKNTRLDWERRFAHWKGPLMIDALLHTFLAPIIEGDERYPKIGKNVPAEASEGWTVVLMDRASRFIGALACGKKEKKLFLSVRQTLKEIMVALWGLPGYKFCLKTECCRS